ncbi:immunoglobulin superfamily member 1-like [Alligator sinensis]|uniref:immunoglobulin superfamily member 1-like n=1 Tax=Alligator sinensis TaxID=38654 RepID=UPI000D72436C|nr:immunoglobulin superfamily member 1-like [Alligator sinensis]
MQAANFNDIQFTLNEDLNIMKETHFLLWAHWNITFHDTGDQGIGSSTGGLLSAFSIAPALTVLLLGCWLALQSRAWGEYPKPRISVIPSWVVALGGNITIHCEGLYPGMKFYLYKTGHTDQLQQEVPGGNVSEFPITKVSWEDGGSYTCNYHPIVDRNSWSYLSDPVELVVRDSLLTKPSISTSSRGVIPLRGCVTIQCECQYVQFYLYKDRSEILDLSSHVDGWNFTIHHARFLSN